jgi:GAF domain-containing protein
MPVRGLRERAYRTGKTVYENDFARSEWAELLPKGHVALGNVLFAPLLVNGITVGLLGLADKPGGFTDHDVHITSAFGELAALSLFSSRTLESLRDSEQRFRAVAQTASDAIITCDSRMRIVFWNESATRMFAHAYEQAIGKR